ncbi:dihydrofolate reductase [Lacticaseibacillus nasuensis]|uniref:dihydrofolate reductase n=1 Tax=Lacticaseibacillus nasuensis TaxID=944671 RepID=UPI002247B472|nr:dihydrofolate reductase [Lacticaseibacillus nasuensis]MCX2455575.1 dihydrofolate reductase [Lacticaseibacillus nasuensis]
MVTFLWAQDQAGTIGQAGHLPWHLPDDLKFFKATTLGQLMLVGRTTYEGLPQRPLPGRTNLVLTRRHDYAAPGAVTVHSVADALTYATMHPASELIVAGGAQVFTAFMPVVQTLLVTRIAGQFAGDVTMPPVPWAEFKRVAAKAVSSPTPELAHVFEQWERQTPVTLTLAEQ